MPEAVATQLSGAFERRKAVLQHRHRGIGVARSPPCPGPRPEGAPRPGASLKTKLEVRKSASECSWNSVRAWPARTPRVWIA